MNHSESQSNRPCQWYYSETRSKKDIIEWAIENKFLRKQECCGKIMKLQEFNQQKTDGFRLRCNRCSTSSSIRKDSFFGNFPFINLATIFELIFNHFSKKKSAKSAYEDLPAELKIGLETIKKIFSAIRILIRRFIIEYEEHFPAGSRVAVDESHFFTSKDGEQYWVVGIVDIDDESHATYYCTNKRDRETLFPFLQYYIETNEDNKSLIITDGWAAYDTLEQLGYLHEIELHNRGFLLRFPHSTNPVERSWSSIKRLLKQYSSSFNKNNLNYFIAEGVLRRRCEVLKFDFGAMLEEILQDDYIDNNLD